MLYRRCAVRGPTGQARREGIEENPDGIANPDGILLLSAFRYADEHKCH